MARGEELQDGGGGPIWWEAPSDTGRRGEGHEVSLLGLRTQVVSGAAERQTRSQLAARFVSLLLRLHFSDWGCVTETGHVRLTRGLLRVHREASRRKRLSSADWKGGKVFWAVR